jgi:DeoR family suf operon transcriptional repressor
MSLIESFGQRQQALLQLLLEHKDGLTMDELARAVEVSKAAVHQHLVALERDGYVAQRELRKTGGRPCQVYALTERGIHLFPKQYAWFAELLLKELIARLGRGEVQHLLYRLGQEVAASLRPRLAGKSAEERRAEVVKMLVELGYEASLEGQTISAKNCVYHDLARQYPEVCALDLGLLDTLLGEVTQSECMVRGGKACKFCALKPADSLGR